MKIRQVAICSMLVLAVTTGCSSLTPTRAADPALAIPGVHDVSSLSPAELDAAVEVAYLDGQLSAEQAHRVRLQVHRHKPSSL